MRVQSAGALLAVCAWASTVPSTAAASDLDDGVTKLIGALQLPSIPGFDLTAKIAVAVSPAEGLEQPESSAYVRALQGLLLTRLETLGAPNLRPLAAHGTQDIDAQAAASGADWLLRVEIAPKEGGALLLGAELRLVDAGLWHPRAALPQPRVLATALRAIPRRDLTSPPAVAPPPAAGDLRFASPPLGIATLPDSVLALSACDLDQDGLAELIALGRASLFVLSYTDSKLVRRAELLLDTLPAAAVRSREPVGEIACGPDGSAYFGSGLLRQGHRVILVAQPGGGPPRIEVTDGYDGVPVARLSEKRYLLAHAEPGRNFWSKSMSSSDGPAPATLVTPVLDLAGSMGAPRWPLYAVLASHRLGRIDEKQVITTEEIPTGVGISTFTFADRTYLVTTSPEVRPARDVIRVWRAPLERPLTEVEIDGAISSSAAGLFRARDSVDVIISVVAKDARTSELLLVPMEGS